MFQPLFLTFSFQVWFGGDIVTEFLFYLCASYLISSFSIFNLQFIVIFKSEKKLILSSFQTSLINDCLFSVPAFILYLRIVYGKLTRVWEFKIGFCAFDLVGSRLRTNIDLAHHDSFSWRAIVLIASQYRRTTYSASTLACHGLYP